LEQTLPPPTNEPLKFIPNSAACSEHWALLPPRKYDWYFMPKQFEKSGRIYELAGVRFYQRLYLATYGKTAEVIISIISRKKTKIYSFKALGGREKLESFETITRQVETIHVLFGIAFSVMTAFKAPFAQPPHLARFLCGAIATNILVNIFPILLQRFNRARLYRLIGREQEKESLDTGHVLLASERV